MFTFDGTRTIEADASLRADLSPGILRTIFDLGNANAKIQSEIVLNSTSMHNVHSFRPVSPSEELKRKRSQEMKAAERRKLEERTDIFEKLRIEDDAMMKRLEFEKNGEQFADLYESLMMQVPSA